MMATIGALVPRMRDICGAGNVITDPLELRTYECDGLTSHRSVPALVVLPRTAAEVASVVAACAAAGDAFDAERYGQAVALFSEVALADNFAEFLTIPAYERMP